MNDSTKIGSKQFIELCTKTLCEYYNSRQELRQGAAGILEPKETYVVWYAKTLQNHKCLMSTTAADGMYFEFTYNGDNNELYLDAYRKWENKKYTVQ